MGNSKNKKVAKKRKAPKKRLNSSHQKENVPKNEKNKVNKPNPNDTISKSKHLKLMINARSKRVSSTKHERICTNGKPMSSLTVLEKMYIDSEVKDQTLPENQTTASINENNLHTPRILLTKLTEPLMGSIPNLPDSKKLLEKPPNSPSLPPDSPPRPPVVSPKKSKKPDVPYTVECKDRPQVIEKPNTNFCTGDDNYGLDSPSEDPEDPPAKRAKKLRMTNSKSIFNVRSDEIAQRLAKDDAGNLSDASSDSNKTIEYNPKPFQIPRPHSFSPLPSTSTDNKTFIKNDELFNESLKQSYATKDATSKEMEDTVTVIATPYETIEIDDIIDSQETTVEIPNTSNGIDTNVTKIIEPVDIEIITPNSDIEILNDDCIIVSCPTQSNNHKDSNESIVIDDEYSTINMDMNTFNDETIEIIDVDDIIAENKSILDKFKKNESKELNNISSVNKVPPTHGNSTLQTTISPSINNNLNISNENNNTNLDNQTDKRFQTSLTGRSTELHSHRQTEMSTLQKASMFQSILNDFFKQRSPSQRNSNLSYAEEERSNMIRFFDLVINGLQAPDKYRNLPSQSVNTHASIHQPTQQRPTTIPPPSSAPLRNIPPCYNNSRTTQRPTAIRPPSHISSRNTGCCQNSRCQQIATIILPSSPISTRNIGDSPNIRRSQQSSIPVSQTSSPEPSRNIGDCPICLDPLTSSGIASTICGHVFCLKCIQAAISTNGKKCPTCRKLLKGAGRGYHQLFL